MERHVLLEEDMEVMGEKICYIMSLRIITKIRASSLHFSIQHFKVKLIILKYF